MADVDDIGGLKRRLERAEAIALAAEERLRRALEAGRMEHWEWDPATDRVRRAGSLAELKALTDESGWHLARDGYALLHPDDRERHVAMVEAARRDRTGWHTEVRFISPETGETRWVEERASPAADPVSGEFRILGFAWDVTARKQAEAERGSALRESEARHRLLIESWAQAVWETDATGVVVADSPSWRAYTGQTLEESLGYGWLAAVHPDDRAGAELQWREAVAARKPLSAEFRVRALDGGWRWTNVRAAPVFDEAGKIEKWLGLNIDVHDRKQAEDALRESEERYRTLFESMDEAYAVVEVLKDDTGRWTDFRFLDVNPAFLHHTTMPWPVGRTASELLGAPNPRWAQLYGQALDTGQPLRVEEHEGTLGLTFDLNIFPLDRDRRRVAILFTNITGRKKVEAALRESEAQFRTLADTAPAVIWRGDAKGESQFVNREFVEFTGKPAEEIRGDGWRAVVHPDDAPAYVADYLAAVKAKRAWRNTTRVRRHDGAWRWFESHAQPLVDAKGDYAGHVGVAVDISDRVEAEQALRALQKRQAFLLDLSDALRLLRDALEVQTTTTRLVAEHLGVDRSMYAEVEGEPGAETGTIIAQFVRQPADGRPPVDPFPDRFTFDPFGAHTMAARYRGEPLVVTDVDRDPAFDAAERAAWRKAGVRAAIVAPLAKGGRLVAEFGVHCVEARAWTGEDVALIQEVAELTWAVVERARAEAALRQSEEKYRSLFEAMDEGYLLAEVLFDEAEKVVDILYLEANPAAASLAGGDFVGRRMRDLDPHYEDYWYEIYGDVALSGESVRAEHFAQPHGRWFEFYVFKVGGPESRRVAAVYKDITERKEAEQALRESEERFQQFSRASAAGLWVRDATTLDMEFISPAISRIYGVGPGAILGDVRCWAAMIVPEDRDIALKRLQEATEGRSVEHEFRIQRPSDGAFRWIRNTDFPLRDDGRIARIGGIAEDVTQAKLAVEHQRVLLAELQHRVRNIMAMIRSMARRTVDGAADVHDYRSLLEAVCWRWRVCRSCSPARPTPAGPCATPSRARSEPRPTATISSNWTGPRSGCRPRRWRC